MLEVFKDYDAVTAYFSDRLDGVSKTPYKGLNLGFHVGDTLEDVQKNHKYVKSYFKNAQEIVYMNQIHSNFVCDTGTLVEVPSCDSLLSKQRQKILMVMVADCIPILFYDKKNSVIAAIHAGRAGVYKNILRETFKQLQENYDCKAEDIVIAIGPHIQECCYEVDKSLADEALALGYKDSVRYDEKRCYVNLYSILMHQFKELGFLSKNLEYINLCTACHTQRYFSYRKEGVTGRFSGVIMLK